MGPTPVEIYIRLKAAWKNMMHPIKHSGKHFKEEKNGKKQGHEDFQNDKKKPSPKKREQNGS